MCGEAKPDARFTLSGKGRSRKCHEHISSEKGAGHFVGRDETFPREVLSPVLASQRPNDVCGVKTVRVFAT